MEESKSENYQALLEKLSTFGEVIELQHEYSGGYVVLLQDTDHITVGCTRESAAAGLLTLLESFIKEKVRLIEKSNEEIKYHKGIEGGKRSWEVS